MHEQILKLVKEANERFPSIDSAFEWLMQTYESDKKLVRATTPAMRRDAMRGYLYDSRHRRMTRVKANACTRGAEAIASTAPAMMQSILDTWTMPDGRVLGDYLGRELKPLAAEESAFAAGHTRKAMFYAAVSDAVDDDDRVRAAITDDEVQELWRSISNVMGETG